MGVPLQVVLDQPEFVWNEVDPGAASSFIDTPRWHEIKVETACRAVNYEDGPMLAVLLASESDGHRVILSVPAVCADRVSLVNIARKISRNYAGNELAAEDEPLQYADLSKWLNELLESEESGEGRSWSQRR